MTVARVTGTLLPSQTIANNATVTAAEVDLLGGDTSEGWIFLYLVFTSTATIGTLDVSLFFGGSTGSEAEQQSPLVGSFVPINGTQTILVGLFRVDRFAVGQVTNNATGVNATVVKLLYTLFKES